MTSRCIRIFVAALALASLPLPSSAKAVVAILIRVPAGAEQKIDETDALVGVLIGAKHNRYRLSPAANGDFTLLYDAEDWNWNSDEGEQEKARERLDELWGPNIEMQDLRVRARVHPRRVLPPPPPPEKVLKPLQEIVPNIPAPPPAPRSVPVLPSPPKRTPPKPARGGSFSANLWNQRDDALQNDLNHIVDGLGLADAAREKSLCVAVVDLADPSSPRVAAINGDEMIYAASLPKIAILLASFVEVGEGRLSLDPDVRQTLERMIRFSSNQDATAMLRRVGKEDLLSILQSDRYRLYDPAHNGGLWVGKEYGDSPAYRRDPLHNLSHGATAMQVARFYYMLATERLVSPQLDREMQEVLGNPGIRHYFVKGLLDEHPDSRIYRKSGTWGLWHADSALIERDGRSYIIVGLTQAADGGQWLVNLIKPVDALLIPNR